MKTLGTSLAIFLIVGSFLLSCTDDDFQKPREEPQTYSTLEFNSPEKTARENDETTLVLISLNKPATVDGVVKITFDKGLSKNFVSTPAAENGTIKLPIRKNDTTISLLIVPVNNSIADGSKKIVFTISEVTNEFLIGVQKSFSFIVDDDEHQDSEANFISGNFEISETFSEWKQIQVHISESATASGAITFTVESEGALYGEHYLTEPDFIGNQLTVPVSSGTSVVFFKVKPVNDIVISGDLDIRFRINATSGNIKKGMILEESFKIKDDELQDMPKGYEVNGGGWNLRRTFHYNASGKVSKIQWDSYTPFHRSGTDTYYYNSSNQLTRINSYPGQDVFYYYDGARIVKEEKVDNGVVDRYTEYAYDDSGNVGSFRTFYLQSDGRFELGLSVLLLYYQDGNLYKKLDYAPTGNSDETYLVATTTFESYREEENPFPMVQVLPNVSTQKQLPSSYRYEANGHNLLYDFSYEFRTDGKVSKRTARQGTTSETAAYNYY
jgi:hypothetical protein